MLQRLREWLGFAPRIDTFAETLIQEFGKRNSYGWSYDAKDGVLRQGEAGMINLANIFRQYVTADRAHRPALLDKYANMAVIQTRPIPTLWEFAAKSVFPAIRDRYDRIQAEISSRTAETPFPPAYAEPFAGDLEIRLVYDWGKHLTQINASLVETWGQTKESVLDRARSNLATLKKPAWTLESNGIYTLSSDEAYQETMLLLDKVVADIASKVAQPAFLPSNRGVLLACDATDEAAVIAMIEQALTNHKEKPWPLSASVLVREHDRWTRATLPPRAAEKCGELERLNAAAVYTGQKQALEAFCQKTGKDIFVATFGLFTRPQDNDAIRSWCSWTETVDTWLPKTDYIVFVNPDDKTKAPMLTRWTDAYPAFAHRMRLLEEQPARYEVLGSFTADEWATIATLKIN